MFSSLDHLLPRHSRRTWTDHYRILMAHAYCSHCWKQKASMIECAPHHHNWRAHGQCSFQMRLRCRSGSGSRCWSCSQCNIHDCFFSSIMSIEIMRVKSLVITMYAAVQRFFAFLLPIWPKMMTADELLWSIKAIE